MKSFEINVHADRDGLPRVSITTSGSTKSLPLRISPMDVALLVELAERYATGLIPSIVTRELIAERKSVENVWGDWLRFREAA